VNSRVKCKGVYLLVGIIECEDMNPRMYEFDGTLRVNEDDRPRPLNLIQFLLRVNIFYDDIISEGSNYS
jgi:hypothetical protein